MHISMHTVFKNLFDKTNIIILYLYNEDWRSVNIFLYSKYLFINWHGLLYPVKGKLLS